MTGFETSKWHTVLQRKRLGAVIVLGSAIVLSTACTPMQPRSSTAQPHDIAPGAVSVTLSNPDSFSRSAGSGSETRAARDKWLEKLSEHLADKVAEVLPAGETAQIRLTDVRRAGSIDQTRSGSVRLVTDMEPPYISFTFEVRARDGKVLRSGERKLQDMSFQSRGARYIGDPLRYEKALIDDWVAREFKEHRN